MLALFNPLSGNFVVNNGGAQTPNDYILKVDHRFSDKDSLSARYLYGDGLDQFPEGNPGAGGGSQLQKYFGVTPATATNFAITNHTSFPQPPSMPSASAIIARCKPETAVIPISIPIPLG